MTLLVRVLEIVTHRQTQTMTSNLKTCIFIGRSGCGKATQVNLLKEYLSTLDPAPIFLVETGAGFRDFIKGDSHSNQLSKAVMTSGARQPDFLAVWMWANVLIESLTGTEHLIFDGTPRALPEAKALDSALDFYDRREVVVIHLNITREEAQRRLLARGRADDRDPTDIEKRLDWFDHDVSPTIEFYRNHDKHKFIELDGLKSIELIHQELVANL